MTTQIALRLEDELVAFLDDRAKEGRGSRASVVTEALRDYRRKLDQQSDVAILKATGDYPDLAGITAYRPLGLD